MSDETTPAPEPTDPVPAEPAAQWPSAPAPAEAAAAAAPPVDAAPAPPVEAVAPVVAEAAPPVAPPAAPPAAPPGAPQTYPTAYPAAPVGAAAGSLPPAYPAAAPGTPPQGTSSNAIIALVLAIGSWFICPIILAIVALVFANMADKELAASGGQPQGKGLVTAAKIVSWINIGLWAAIIVIGAFVLVIVAIAGGMSSGTSA